MQENKPKEFLWTDLFSKRSDAEITVASALKQNHLFKLLSIREIKEISKFVHLRNYQPGEAVFIQGEKGLGMYIIAKGAVEIRTKHPLKSNEELSITSLHAGSFFGELALIDADSKRSATAYVTEPSLLIGFFKPDLIEIIERKPSTGVKILQQLTKVIGRRLIRTTEALTQTAAGVTALEQCEQELKKAA